MSIITINTAFNIDLEFKVAPLHKRIFAWLIDMVIIGSFTYLMMEFAIPDSVMTSQQSYFFIFLFVALPAFSYHFVLELIWNGQTVGKKLMGIKVIDMDGREPSLSQYLLRWLLRLIDVGITMGIGALLTAIFTKYSQRLGDLAAGTVVIDQTGKTNLKETIYLDVTEDKAYKPVFPEVMRLTDRDINGIRNLLDTKYTKENDTYTLQVTQRIKEVLHIEADMEPRTFLEQLLHDYNFLTRK